MRRRAFITAAASLVGELQRTAGAQPAGRLYRQGILDLGSAPAHPASPCATTVLLRELVPRARRIALLMPDDTGATAQQQVRETRAAAASIGLGLDVVEVRGGDYARAFASLAALRPPALVVGSHLLFMRDRKTVIELVARARLPAIYEWPRQVKEGGLMSYGANEIETYRQVASYIDRVFKGAKPADLPIWQPSKLHLVINRKTAKALDITLPQSLLLRADEVIE